VVTHRIPIHCGLGWSSATLHGKGIRREDGIGHSSGLGRCDAGRPGPGRGLGLGRAQAGKPLDFMWVGALVGSSAGAGGDGARYVLGTVRASPLAGNTFVALLDRETGKEIWQVKDPGRAIAAFALFARWEGIDRRPRLDQDSCQGHRHPRRGQR